MSCGRWGSNRDGGSSKNVSVCVRTSECVHQRYCLRCSNMKWPFFCRTYNVLWNGVEYTMKRCMFGVRACGWKKIKHMCPKRGLKIVWPEFRTMCYLLQIDTDMIGLVVIITWEHLVLFSLNHCNGKQELFQRTVGAIPLLDSISVSLWLLDNSIFGKAGGKMCDVNSP